MPGFENPLLLWGTALFSVPLIIHLLNRRKYQRIPWAAISFLLSAHRQNRRRLQMENLLLLLARCLAVILLAFAFSRPYLSGDSPIIPLAEKRKDVILALDNSFSMDLQVGVETPFQRGVNEAMKILDGLKSERGDRATLMLSSKNPTVLTWRDPVLAREALTRLDRPALLGADFPTTLDWIRRIAEDFRDLGEGSEIVVYWISDLQKQSFLTEEDQAQGLESLVASLADLDCKIRVVDVGPPASRPANLALADLSLEELEPNFAGSPLPARATIRNFGNNDAAEVRVRFSLDGNPYSSEVLTIPAGQEREASVILNVPDAGSHALSATLEGDSLVADDSRHHAFWVRPPAKILLIDGDPQSEKLLSETGFLSSILNPTEDDPKEGETRPFLAATLERHEFFANPQIFANYDLAVLANLEGFQDEGLAVLDSFVRNGKSVLFTLGDRVDPNYYNAILRKDGSGKLLPARLVARTTVASRRTEYFRIAYPDIEHPAFQFFQDERWRPLLTEIPVFEFFSTVVDAEEEGAQIIAALDDRDQSPLIIEKEVGRGRTALLTTSLDNAWNRIPESPKTFIPLVFDWFRYLTARETGERDLEVGSPILVETTKFPRKAAWVDPEGKKTILEGAPRPLGSDRFALPEITATDTPGMYLVEVEEAAGAQGINLKKTFFGVNVDHREGNLERIPVEAMQAYFPGITIDLADSPESMQETGGPSNVRGEIWKALLIAGILLLILESILSAWFGRRRTATKSAGGKV